MRNTRWFQAVLVAAGVSASVAHAGTVTVDRIFADGIYVREIGMRPPKAPETLYYPFASDGGGTTEDMSGNGYVGTVSGCVWTNSGPHGGSVFFDGVNDYIDVGAAPDFPAWGAYTVSVWFLHNGGGDFGEYDQCGHKIIDKTTWYHDWCIYLWPPNGGVGLRMYENGFGYLIDETVNYKDGVWHHVAVTRDGTDGQLWLDGVLKASCGTMFPVYSSSDVCVGNSFSGDSLQQKCWSGMLDEVRIFDRALSSNEVVRLYTEGALLATNAAPDAVVVSTNLTVMGGLAVTGQVSFAGGVRYVLPLGDLSSGIYTNAP